MNASVSFESIDEEIGRWTGFYEHKEVLRTVKCRVDAASEGRDELSALEHALDVLSCEVARARAHFLKATDH